MCTGPSEVSRPDFGAAIEILRKHKERYKKKNYRPTETFLGRTEHRRTLDTRANIREQVASKFSMLVLVALRREWEFFAYV